MNKNISKIIASNFGFKIPKWVMNEGCEKIGFPCVIKPTNGGSSIGVSIVNNEDEYNRAIELSKRYDCDVMIEQMIKGREFSVGVLDGKALPVIEIAPKSGFYDYKNKYIAGTLSLGPWVRQTATWGSSSTTQWSPAPSLPELHRQPSEKSTMPSRRTAATA